MNEKRCGGCGDTKPIEAFNLYQRNKADGRQPRCRDCQGKSNAAWRERNREKSRAGARAWNAAHPEQAAEHHYKSRYGITWTEYDAMFTAQRGVCAICSEHCPSGQRLSVDHDHATGAVRQLLCRRCNSGLANFRDRPDLLTAALGYLVQHSTI